MSVKYADIIVDITNDKLDKVFSYRIPEHLEKVLRIGMEVLIPFGNGNRKISGYVVGFRDSVDYDGDKVKEIAEILPRKNAVTADMVELAAWIAENYGSTMIQALKTVLPARTRTSHRGHRSVKLILSPEQAEEELERFLSKNQTARARLMAELIDHSEIPYEIISSKLHVTSAVVKAFEEKGFICIHEECSIDRLYGSMMSEENREKHELVLNPHQRSAVTRVCNDMKNGDPGTYLLYGVTGSGKTEVYIRIVEEVVKNKGQAIMLIPEIALTYQTVMRFYERFGNRVSVMNSRLSAGEKYEEYLRCQNGSVDVVIGPRSALFMPLQRLKLIIVDEEHETSYKSEITPRYHAVPVAVKRAEMAGASVILGSATPSLESYSCALKGEYKLLTLPERVMERPMARVHVEDMRSELKEGNRSMLSNALDEAITDRLERGEQIMLFLNRRGYAGCAACRECGYVVKCDHCDVSMSYHKDITAYYKAASMADTGRKTGKNISEGAMVCHYCNDIKALPPSCPKCGSAHIGVFKAGTQQVEKMVRERYPEAKVLRMDMDTTRDKEGHTRILSAFANREADILIGTQMIVKGHDFPGVTLVGILAADMSVNSGDYRSGERTFQLITQACGRAGRGDDPGDVYIQTYDPENYIIVHAAMQDYKGFYEDEIQYRELMDYPPRGHILTVRLEGNDDAHLDMAADYLKKYGDRFARPNSIQCIGPSVPSIGRVKDRYRKVLYYKHQSYDILVRMRLFLEAYTAINSGYDSLLIQYDYDG